ncbi:MAG TPA: hypothetical protein DCR04_06740 [Flavobacteriales bacterium]|nr:hypothetical protein [Flavobacteriales bacterium]
MKTAILSILIVLFSAHEFHLSLTAIKHNAESKSLEVSVKLFTDDLLIALEQGGAPKMELGTENEPPEASELVESYLKAHFKLTVNGKPTDFVYLGKEAELDATWCYVEVKDVKKVKTIEVQNTLLLEAFDDQTNMINLNIDGRKKSGLARKERTKLKFEF